jgi:type I restriction enzyme S subunit
MNQEHLPPHWKLARLEDVAKIKQGGVIDASALKEEGYPVYGANGRIGYWDSYHYDEPQVLVTCRGSTCGTINISEPKSFVSNNAMAILSINNNSLFRNYLGYCLIHTDLRCCITGTGQPQITKGLLGRIAIPIPSILEQYAIVQGLNAVQEAKEARRREAALERERKAALMDYLFTHGTHGEPRQQTEIGEIPQSWRVVKLGEVCSLRNEIVSPSDNHQERYIGLEHIDPGIPYLTKWGFASEVTSSKSRFYAGDLLYGKLRPYLDKAIFADFSGICSTDILVIRPSESLVNSFLVNLVHTIAFLNYAIKTMSGVNHPRTSWSSLSLFKIPMPCPEEQDEISIILKTCDGKIIALEQEAALLEELFRAMLEELMTGRLSALPLVEGTT